MTDLLSEHVVSLSGVENNKYLQNIKKQWMEMS